MNTLSAAGETLIKNWEGLRGKPRGRPSLKVYLCPAGVPTIGWGHTGPDVLMTSPPINEAESEILFKRDARRFEACVNQMCASATEAEFDAMVALCFNIGEGAYPGKKGKPGFRTSSVARLHNAGKYAEAAQAFALWNKCAGKINDGLVARRGEEAAMYRSGIMDLEDAGDTGAPQMCQDVDGEGQSSRTIKGATLAGSAVAAGPVVGAAPGMLDHLQGAQDTVMQLMPYFDAMKWALLALSLAGLGYVVYARLNDRHTGRS